MNTLITVIKFSVALSFVRRKDDAGGNVFMWLALCMGNGLFLSLFSMEWYARINCPPTHVSLATTRFCTHNIISSSSFIYLFIYLFFIIIIIIIFYLSYSMFVYTKYWFAYNFG